MKLKYGEYAKFKNGYIGKVENINDFREPSMKYAIDIQKDDLVFVGEDYIVIKGGYYYGSQEFSGS